MARTPFLSSPCPTSSLKSSRRWLSSVSITSRNLWRKSRNPWRARSWRMSSKSGMPTLLIWSKSCCSSWSSLQTTWISSLCLIWLAPLSPAWSRGKRYVWTCQKRVVASGFHCSEVAPLKFYLTRCELIFHEITAGRYPYHLQHYQRFLARRRGPSSWGEQVVRGGVNNLHNVLEKQKEQLTVSRWHARRLTERTETVYSLLLSK